MVDTDTIAESAMAKAYVCIKYGTVLVYVATWLFQLWLTRKVANQLSLLTSTPARIFSPSAEEKYSPAPTGRRAGDAGGNRTADRSGVGRSIRVGIEIFNKQ